MGYQNHIRYIQITIGYTLMIAFVAIVIITIASLVGWVKLVHEDQQYKLFEIFVVELVIGALGFFTVTFLKVPVKRTGQHTLANVVVAKKIKLGKPSKLVEMASTAVEIKKHEFGIIEFECIDSSKNE